MARRGRPTSAQRATLTKIPDQTEKPKLSNGPSPELIASTARKILAQEAEVEKAKGPYDTEKGRLRSLYKAAKADGINIDALNRVLKFKRMAPHEAQDQVAAEVRYAKYLSLPFGTQFGLFDGIDVPEHVQAEQSRDAAHEKGFAAGRAGGGRAENPYDPGSEFYPLWDRAWELGQRDIVAGMAPGAAAGNAGVPEPDEAREGAGPEEEHGDGVFPD